MIIYQELTLSFIKIWEIRNIFSRTTDLLTLLIKLQNISKL